MSYVEDLHRAKLERRMRFAQAALRHLESKAQASTPAEVIKIEATPAPTPEPTEMWVERQIERFKTPWFEIIEGPESLDKAKDRKPPEIRAIQRVVGRHYLISLADMLSERRTADVVRPRQIAMYLAKQLTERSLPEIGKRFGGRDHTTVLHAVRKITLKVARDAKFAVEIDELSKKCEAL